MRRSAPGDVPMIYERIAWRYMWLVIPAIYAEMAAGMHRGSVSRMKCLEYIKHRGWVTE